jgi:hypothetical protein
VTVPREQKVGCIALPSYVESSRFKRGEKVELRDPSVETGGLKLLDEVGIPLSHPRERLSHGCACWRVPASLGHDFEPLVQAVVWHDGVEEVSHVTLCSGSMRAWMEAARQRFR